MMSYTPGIPKLLLILLVTMTTKAQVFNITRRCTSDIVFALDQSTSMRPTEFRQMTLFTSIIINDLEDYGLANGTQAGLIKFSTGSTVEFELTDYTVAADAADRAIATVFNGGLTNTHLALADMKRMLQGGRPNVEKIGIIITDGIATEIDLTTAAAKELHALGYNIAVVAIGVQLNVTALRDLASDPRLFKPVADFDELNDLQTEINSIICRDVCPETPYNPAAVTFRNEQELSYNVVGVRVDLLQAEPFRPIIWSTRGLCTGNDVSIVPNTRAFTQSVLAIINSSPSFEEWQRDCYRAAMNSLLVELNRAIVDCAKIARLVTCANKILALVQESLPPGLVSNGQSLQSTWRTYTTQVGTVTDANDARRIIGLQEQLIADWRQRRANSNNAQEIAELTTLINELQKVIDLNNLKLTYDDQVKDMVIELGKNPRDNAAISSLQAQMLSQLRQMLILADDATERNNLQTAINRLQSAINLNTDYIASVNRLIVEENRNPRNGEQLLAAQRDVNSKLLAMRNAAGTAVERAAIQSVINALGAVINFNDRVVQHNNIVRQINTEIANNPQNSPTISNLKNNLINSKRSIVNIISDPSLISTLNNQITAIGRELQIDTVTVSYNNQVTAYNTEIVRDPVDPPTIVTILSNMATELQTLLQFLTDPAETARLQALITNTNALITCWRGL